MQKLIAWAENQMIKSAVNNYKNRIFLAEGRLPDLKESMQAVSAEMRANKGRIENLVKAFLDGAVADPRKAFQDVLVKQLNLDKAIAESTFSQAIKTALGDEVKTPSLTYAQILSKIAEPIANYKAFNYIREHAGPKGEGWLIRAEDIADLGPDALRDYVPVSELETRIPGFKNAFSGLWVPRGFVEEMESTYKIFTQDNGGVVQGMLFLNNLSLMAQTSLSPVRGPIRNFLSNPFLFLASGKYQLNELKPALTKAWAIVKQKDVKATLNQLEELYDLGIIDDQPDMGMAAEYFRIAKDKASQESLLNGILKGKWVEPTGDLASRWYTMGDNIWRIAMYEINQKTLRKAYGTRLPERLGGFEAGTTEYEKVLKREASNWTKNEIPSYSRMNELVLIWKIPGISAVVGPFVGWRSEMIRVSYANLVQAYENIKNGRAENNDVLIRDGYRRLGGTALAYSIPLAIAAWFLSMFDIDEEEEEAARATLPPWDKKATLIWWRNPKTGKLNYFNASFLTPFSITTDPMRVFGTTYKSDPDGGAKAFANAFGATMLEGLEGYFSPQIATKATAEALFNDSDGKQIYNTEDSLTNKMLDIA